MVEKQRWIVLTELINKYLDTAKQLVGVELGVATGITSRNLLENISLLKLYGIDRYKEYEDKYYCNLAKIQAAEKEADSLLKQFAIKGSYVKVKKTSAEAQGSFLDGSLDFIFIDADHSYDAVRKDLELWYPKIKTAGLICGDDYENHNFPGIKKAVDEFAIGHNKSVNFRMTISNYSVFYFIK